MLHFCPGASLLLKSLLSSTSTPAAVKPLTSTLLAGGGDPALERAFVALNCAPENT